MTARLSESAAAGRRATRVMSVSPMTARSLAPELKPTLQRSAETSPPALTRDGDTAALTQRARELIASLSCTLDQAALGDAQTRDTMRSLQDRLRVGARMLQAFQVQIARLESGIAELEHQRETTERAMQADAARLDDQAAAFEQRLEAALEQFERRLSEMPRVR